MALLKFGARARVLQFGIVLATMAAFAAYARGQGITFVDAAVNALASKIGPEIDPFNSHGIVSGIIHSGGSDGQFHVHLVVRNNTAERIAVALNLGGVPGDNVEERAGITIDTAVFRDGRGRGWWMIDQGKQMQIGELPNKVFYYRVESAGGRVWAGGYNRPGPSPTGSLYMVRADQGAGWRSHSTFLLNVIGPPDGGTSRGINLSGDRRILWTGQYYNRQANIVLLTTFQRRPDNIWASTTTQMGANARFAPVNQDAYREVNRTGDFVELANVNNSNARLRLTGTEVQLYDGTRNAWTDVETTRGTWR
jgi:hypothetical protein